MTSRKTTYINSPIHITELQLRKLKLNETCIVRIDPCKKANHHLLLKQTQVNQLNNAKSARTSKDPNFSKTQLEKNRGFIITIPTLLAGIVPAASMAGAAGGIAKAVNEKKHNDKIDKIESKAKRHNKQEGAPTVPSAVIWKTCGVTNVL
jgi:hypothetical protein